MNIRTRININKATGLHQFLGSMSAGNRPVIARLILNRHGLYDGQFTMQELLEYSHSRRISQEFLTLDLDSDQDRFRPLEGLHPLVREFVLFKSLLWVDDLLSAIKQNPSYESKREPWFDYHRV